MLALAPLSARLPVQDSLLKINLVDLFVYFCNLVRGVEGGRRGEEGEEGVEGGGGSGRGEEGEERQLQWIQWRCFVTQDKSRTRPWGFFFFRESFLFAVKFFRLPWVFFFLPWGSSFCRESFSFASRLFFLPRGYFFCCDTCEPPYRREFSKHELTRKKILLLPGVIFSFIVLNCCII